jgi:hypothetical protein
VVAVVLVRFGVVLEHTHSAKSVNFFIYELVYMSGNAHATALLCLQRTRCSYMGTPNVIDRFPTVMVLEYLSLSSTNNPPFFCAECTHNIHTARDVRMRWPCAVFFFFFFFMCMCARVCVIQCA